MKYINKIFYYGKLVVVIASCMLLSGCNNVLVEPADPVTSFTCDADVKMADNVITCKLTRNAEGISEITVTTPVELEGLKFKWLGDGYSISFHELACETQTSSLPENSFATSIINVLNEISKPESLTLVSSQKDCTTYSGNSDSGKFQTTIENATGLIQELKLDDSAMLVTLKNYS